MSSTNGDEVKSSAVQLLCYPKTADWKMVSTVETIREAARSRQSEEVSV